MPEREALPSPVHLLEEEPQEKNHGENRSYITLLYVIIHVEII